MVTSDVIVSHRPQPAALSHCYGENPGPACPEKRKVTPLNATLMGHLASVANKTLTASPNPLDATLIKNRGRGYETGTAGGPGIHPQSMGPGTGIRRHLARPGARA